MVASGTGASTAVDGDVTDEDDEPLLKRTPTTVLGAVVALGFVGVSLVMDYYGYDVFGGVTATFGVVLFAVAVFGQVLVWASARL